MYHCPKWMHFFKSSIENKTVLILIRKQGYPESMVFNWKRNRSELKDASVQIQCFYNRICKKSMTARNQCVSLKNSVKVNTHLSTECVTVRNPLTVFWTQSPNLRCLFAVQNQCFCVRLLLERWLSRIKAFRKDICWTGTNSEPEVWLSRINAFFKDSIENCDCPESLLPFWKSFEN